jgi:hypothetical protein
MPPLSALYFRFKQLSEGHEEGAINEGLWRVSCLSVLSSTEHNLSEYHEPVLKQLQLLREEF